MIINIEILHIHTSNQIDFSCHRFVKMQKIVEIQGKEEFSHKFDGSVYGYDEIIFYFILFFIFIFCLLSFCF